MKITVAIPCYNLEDRIATCLKSVISQDYLDIEILVIDDHSTDRSVEVVNNIIEQHPERDFRFIINEVNIGLSEVRNVAIREARGEALFFVDGDDVIELGTLSLFQHRMEETGVEVVCGSFRKLDYEGNTYIVKQCPNDTIKGSFAYASYIEKYINGYFDIAVWNKLYRLDFLRFHNIRCASHYRSFEDRLFTFRVVLNASSVSFIRDVTYNYWDFSTSIVHQKRGREFLLNYRAVIESVIEAKKDFEDVHKKQLTRYGIRFLLNYICLTDGLLKMVIESNVGKEEKKSLLKWLKDEYRNNCMNWNTIVGTYNRFSYLILISPFPYTLFRFYFKHLKTIAGIVGNLTK